MLQYCSFLLHSGITICLSAEYSDIECKKAANMSKRVAINYNKSSKMKFRPLNLALYCKSQKGVFILSLYLCLSMQCIVDGE